MSNIAPAAVTPADARRLPAEVTHRMQWGRAGPQTAAAAAMCSAAAHPAMADAAASINPAPIRQMPGVRDCWASQSCMGAS